MTGDDDPLQDGEDEHERNSRRLQELLQEVRVATAGVQILFGFLLAVPFQQGFADVTSFERDVYAVVLMCTAVSSALMIAPTALHRLLFRQGQKPEIIEYANAMVIAGLVLLAVAMVATVLLIGHVIFGATTAVVLSGGLGIVFAVAWFAIPLSRRAKRS